MAEVGWDRPPIPPDLEDGALIESADDLGTSATLDVIVGELRVAVDPGGTRLARSDTHRTRALVVPPEGHTWEDQAFEVRARWNEPVLGEGWSGIHGYLRYRDDNHHLLLSLRRDGFVSIKARVCDEHETLLQRELGPVEQGRWYHLVFRADGDRFSMAVDGVQVVTVVDDRYPHGTFGLRADYHSIDFANWRQDDSPPPVPPEPEWIELPAGSYAMGSAREADELPIHEVEVPALRVGRNEVTNAQYLACVAAGACSPPHWDDLGCQVWDGEVREPAILPESFRGSDQPVVCVTWHQADAFARWVGGKLPSEAEFEYAARSGGLERTYPWGEQLPDCSRVVKSEGGLGCGTGAPLPVCSTPAGNTPQGLCDVVGNVTEWVQDTHHDSYEGAPADGSAWEEPHVDPRRVLRSGSYLNGPAHRFRCAARRGSLAAGEAVEWVGFRVAAAVAAVE